MIGAGRRNPRHVRFAGLQAQCSGAWPRVSACRPAWRPCCGRPPSRGHSPSGFVVRGDAASRGTAEPAFLLW